MSLLGDQVEEAISVHMRLVVVEQRVHHSSGSSPALETRSV